MFNTAWCEPADSELSLLNIYVPTHHKHCESSLSINSYRCSVSGAHWQLNVEVAAMVYVVATRTNAFFAWWHWSRYSIKHYWPDTGPVIYSWCFIHSSLLHLFLETFYIHVYALFETLLPKPFLYLQILKNVKSL